VPPAGAELEVSVDEVKSLLFTCVMIGLVGFEQVPVPVRLIMYGFSSMSLLAMLNWAVLLLVIEGEKVTENVVVDPEATVVEAGWFTINSFAFAPEIITLGLLVRFKTPVPVFSMVNVTDVLALPIS